MQEGDEARHSRVMRCGPIWGKRSAIYALTTLHPSGPGNWHKSCFVIAQRGLP